MRRTIRMKYLNPKGRFPSGNVRFYYRRDGRQIAMPDFPPDHPEFLAQYATAAKSFGPDRTPGPKHVTGTIGAAVRAFLASDEFMARAASTRAVWRRILERIEAEAGRAKMADLRPRHIRQDLARLDPHPANNKRKVWRALCSWCLDRGLTEIDAAADVRPRLTQKTEGHKPWTRDEIEAFRERWGYGTAQRLAFELIYWTGARRSDAVRLGPGMIDAQGWLVYTQQKTGGKVAVPLTCTAPAWAEPDDHLGRAMDAQTGRHMTWIVTRSGRSRSVKAFGKWFSDAARAAGVTKTAHGLRKTRATIMKENGATQDQRMAWLGHESSVEAEAYADSADRRRIISGTENAHSGETTAQSGGNILVKQSLGK